MCRPGYALYFVLITANACAAWGQVSLAPEKGLLVLRNGQVLDGDVTRAGDYYIVTKGEGTELRLKAEEVEAFCGSLEEAYDFKVAHLSGISARPHIELARWCLRHGLFEKCSEQIDAAERAEPGYVPAKELRTRLKLAVESAPPAPAAQAATPAIAGDELEKTIHQLPRGSIEKFSAVIQPILLNRCGANQCHGPNGPSEFRLLRPPAGQIVSRRFTQRNLYSAVKYLDANNPDASPLVIKPQQRHGNSLAAVFDKHSSQQLGELLQWASMTVGSGGKATPGAPASIAPMESTLSQPAAAAASLGEPNVALPRAEAPAAVGVRVMRPALDSQGAAGGAALAQPQAPRDRYDPDIFNRHYHGR